MNNLMKMFSFTKSETKVILFIISVLIAGFSIKYYKQVISNGSLSTYDYTKSDSVFKKRSQNKDIRLSITETDTSGTNKDQIINLLKASDDSLNLKLKALKENVPDEISGAKLNINTATKNDFVDLPGIGESIADKIITYRDRKNGFAKIEDLLNVSGIGKKKFEKIKNYIKTE